MDTKDYDDFLALRPRGNADLVVHAPDHSSFSFRNLNEQYLIETCPLLAFSFEERPQGRKSLSLNASSVELVARFLRFIYTATYHIVDDHKREISCSFLMHAQLYRYGELYDLPQLRSRAYIHISQICELGCSMPSAPVGLCETLRFLYDKVTTDKTCHESILHYCISRFNAHHLGTNPEFCKLLAEVKECQQDMFRLVAQRGFQDESKCSIHPFRYNNC